MSAWIVSKTHIDALVQAGIEDELVRPAEADEFGRLLWRENLASIHFRYPDTVESGSYPGPIDFKASDVDEYTYEPLEGEAGISRQAPSVVRQTALCYDYQTCEHPEYNGSAARWFIVKLTGLTAHDEADGPWGTDNRDAFLAGAAQRATK
jgi:hypothetical protein